MIMKTINYKISFYSPWHCGSGLAAGADVDLLVIKDKWQLPFVPGKTVKGLVKEWAMTINNLHNMTSNESFAEAFGEEKKSQGCMYFTNAELPEDIKAAVVAERSQDFLYSSISSTSIGADGIAVDHSLRKIEATIPCDLIGYIKNVPDEIFELLTLSLKSIKHIGASRNRGLGRCDVTFLEGGKA